MRLGFASGLALVVLAALGIPTTLVSTGTAAVAQPIAPAGAARGLTTVGAGGWSVLTSSTATQGGAKISAPGFNTSGWLSVAPDDAGAPGTEIAALLQNGKCPNVFFADNMKTCFGYTGKVGPVTVPQFSVPWWYRTDFTPNLTAGQAASLIVNGVVGKADVWVNGHEVATNATVTGAYTRFTFDVTSLLTSGTNSLAVEVYPNDPTTMLTVDNVDWSQIPPDNNTGIQFPIQLQVSDALSVGNAHVVQDTAANLSSSALTVKTDVTNSTASSQTGTVVATVTPPSGGGSPITVQQSVTVAAHATQTVTFSPSAFPSLTISQPKVWWPYQMGAQPLYTLDTSVGGASGNSTHETFGIRTVGTSLIGKSAAAPDGVRQYSVNGVPFVLRGGGFASDMFLRYSSADAARQIALLKNLGLNTVRLEGHFAPDDLYQQLDAAGIMVDAGFQCCDAWEPSGTPSQADLNVMKLSALTIGQHERNHPSVITLSWSDNAPGAQQESVSLQAFQQADFDVPFVASAEYNSGQSLGPSGEKEGPYDYVPPSYWYDTSHFSSGDSTRTNAGGSWGLDSEQSAGDTIPTLDSINRFLSPSDQANLWQNPSFNQYHANYESGHGGYKFGTLFVFDQALTNRYGKWHDLASYVQEAQLQNYENTRSQFEAFLAHSTNQPTPATGTIYWQANKGWPSLLWTLFNSDGDQAGSFFGAKKANETLHAILAQDNNTVVLDNLGSATQSGLSVESKVYNTNGAVLDDQTASGISLAGQQVRTSVLSAKVPSSAPGNVYFVELLLKQNGTVVDRNVYWQSTKQDVVNWTSTLGQPQATMTQYADLSGLNSLAQAKISATATSSAQPGSNGADRVAKVTVTNTSSTPTVGFFLRADLRRGTGGGAELPGDNQVASALWDDNDVTLWPGESQTLSVGYRSADLAGATPVISVSGNNVAKVDVVAGGGTPTPAVPSGLTVTGATNSSIDLSWTENNNADPAASYKVYEGGTVVATPTGTSASIGGLAAGSTHTYTVAAVDAAGAESAQSASATGTTSGGATAPAVPSGLTVTGSTDTSLGLSWTENNNADPAASYKVYEGGTVVATPTTTSATITGLAAGSTHTHTVTAVDSAGNESAHSASATGTTTSPTGAITNGGFESGDFTGWTRTGTTNITTAGPHSGTHAAMLGAKSPTNGDSTVKQTFTVPAGATQLSFYYSITCPDEVRYDWATAKLKDNTTGVTTAPLAKTCTNGAGWKPVTAAVTAGHSYTLTLVSHDENSPGDATYTLYDDVTINGAVPRVSPMRAA
ncbi:beta-mannosidase [Solihabitans fulvus]|uniref:Beta-mannosidase n=2 Tax=Solihabitans fulvus TaxID=1892852 RepID=A0A5B2XLL3_9PSEU|nr:beta-mannosidase [Solihabitans fulvus]